MKFTQSHSEGYSIIASIMMIWFLLILTTSTLNLVLQELNDGRGRQNYLKAFAGAEWGLELALLQIKEYGYWYDEDNFSWSVLWSTGLDPTIAYDFDSRVSSYSWTLDPYSSEIIPLFSINNLGVVSYTSGIDFTVNSPGMAWNIIGSSIGISWTWSFVSSGVFSARSSASFSALSVSDFLTANTGSYLSLYNTSSLPLTYTISGNGIETHFSRPKAEIFSWASIWKYSQNLRTEIDNTEFLWVLKYSIYSWN